MILVGIMVIAGIVLLRGALNNFADHVNHPSKAAAAMAQAELDRVAEAEVDNHA